MSRHRGGLIVAGAALVLALGGCVPAPPDLDPSGTTSAVPVPENRAPASVGEAHESEVPAGWDEAGDTPVVPVAELTPDDRRDLLRLEASSDRLGDSCETPDLAVDLVFTDAAMGHRYGVVTVENTSAASCSVRGYPGLGARGAWGHRFFPEVRQNPMDLGWDYLPGGEDYVPEALALAPGEQAQLTFEWTGALGGHGSEPLGDLLLQPFRGADPVPVAGAAEQATDISTFTTLKVGPFLPASTGASD